MKKAGRPTIGVKRYQVTLKEDDVLLFLKLAEAVRRSGTVKLSQGIRAAAEMLREQKAN